MRKESRANVIFFLVLLVLIAPGFVILMRKKLSGPTDPAHLPTMIPHQAAYIQPDPIPPRAPRVEPAAVRSWVTQQLHDRVDPNASVVRDQTGAGPLVGDKFVTQIVHRVGGQLVLLIWRAEIEPLSFETKVDGASLGVPSVEWVDVPKDVRHSLQKVGYTDPPERIAWVEVPLTAVPANAEVSVSYDGRTEHLRLP